MRRIVITLQPPRRLFVLESHRSEERFLIDGRNLMGVWLTVTQAL
jgi:hypothetical protein